MSIAKYPIHYNTSIFWFTTKCGFREFEQLRSCQAWYAENSRYIILQSYYHIVSVFDKQTGILYENKFSRTTSRQQTWWKRDAGINKHGINDTKSLEDFRNLNDLPNQ